jgi:hypothetical protein
MSHPPRNPSSPTIDFLNAPVAIDNRNGTVTAP